MEYVSPSSMNLIVPNAVFFAFALYAILWLWCIVDLLRSEFKDKSVKMLWVLLLIFANPLAPFVYGHLARKQKLRYR